MSDECGIAHVLEQMLSQHDHVLCIHDAVTPGHWADITQGVVFAPVVNHYAHVGAIDNSVTVQVNYRHD